MIHCRTLTKATLGRILGFQLGDVAATTEQGDSIAILVGLRHHVIEIRTHTRMNLEITIDHFFRFIERDMERLRKAICLLTVHNAEINRFCSTAHLWRNIVHRNAEHARSRAGVKILTRIERGNKMLIP